MLITAFIEEASIPVCMVGLLYALPGTQLTRRLAAEGRLHEGHDLMTVEHAGDQCTLGCNFDTRRPLRRVRRTRPTRVARTTAASPLI